MSRENFDHFDTGTHWQNRPRLRRARPNGDRYPGVEITHRPGLTDGATVDDSDTPGGEDEGTQ